MKKDCKLSPPFRKGSYGKDKMTKYIIVCGGVMSGLGKGVTTASIGRLLVNQSFDVTALKIDPYVNIDAGTLRPTEHGEVWVTGDGGEIDQDLGNYERFLDITVPKKNNITTGQVYLSVIEKERRLEYKGKDVRLIPDVMNEIKDRVKQAGKGHDFALVEIGGTTGDLENRIFLEAVRQMKFEGEKIMFVLVVYVPFLEKVGELKTKPAQHSAARLREMGIAPDFVVTRSTKRMDKSRLEKISNLCYVKKDHIFENPDVDSIYEIPLLLEKQNATNLLLSHFSMEPAGDTDKQSKWSEFVEKEKNAAKNISVAIVGKYIKEGDSELEDVYLSVKEAVKHAATQAGAKPKIVQLQSNQLEEGNVSELEKFDAVIIPGGFGSSGTQGKINAIQYCRENNKPFLGLCYGLQLAVIEYARNKCNMQDANSTEINPKTDFPVIDILKSQRKLMDNNNYGGTMRLGAYAATLKKDSIVFDLYKKCNRIKKDRQKLELMQESQNFKKYTGILNETDNMVLERHRHRFEVNPKFVSALKENGLKISGKHCRAMDGTELVEFIELPKQKHAFFVATQAHPEFKSRPLDPAPLFVGLVDAALESNSRQ